MSLYFHLFKFYNRRIKAIKPKKIVILLTLFSADIVNLNTCNDKAVY